MASASSSAATSAVATPAGPSPNYFSVQEDPNYEAAKKLLQSSTEDCMECVQVMMTSTLERVGEDTHPAMAPLFYLYGTAL
ncbi:hypothetical protein TeGR_g15263 [Tetraparma gracilis]|uniref:Uncharacterized protein n=1 Tax=Tetraparma gracilis TaxID=2962635 RepID=A0ABQ6MRM1_9STRA|nr:hypothetical protein TeGR_g15263 [Tetraparma gracilis]